MWLTSTRSSRSQFNPHISEWKLLKCGRALHWPRLILIQRAYFCANSFRVGPATHGGWLHWWRHSASSAKLLHDWLRVIVEEIDAAALDISRTKVPALDEGRVHTAATSTATSTATCTFWTSNPTSTHRASLHHDLTMSSHLRPFGGVIPKSL